MAKVGIEVSDLSISKDNCDWIVDKAKELKSLFSHDSENMVKINKSRVLADISTMQDSLAGLKRYVDSL